MNDLEDGWTSHIAPTGHTYYYNRSTKQSTYKRPTKRSTPPAPISEAVSNPDTPTPTVGTTDIPQATRSGSDIQKSNTLSNAESQAPETAHSLPQQHNVVNKTGDGDYPKHKFEISTADPWLLIETKKGREFYHNPQTNESHWELPTWLSEPLRQWRKSLEEQISDSELDNGIEEDDPSDESQDDNFMPVDTEYNEEDIAWQLAAMEEEGQGQIHGLEDDTPEFRLSEKIEIFQKMLSDLAIDPFSTWDAELPRIAADPRYLILENTHQRKSAFENYCTEQGMKIQEEKATTVKEDVSTKSRVEQRLMDDSLKRPSYNLSKMQQVRLHTSRTSSGSTRKTVPTRTLAIRITNARSCFVLS